VWHCDRLVIMRSNFDAVARHANLLPGRLALIDDVGNCLSYQDLHDSALRFAGQLMAAGISLGDRMALWASNSGEWWVAHLGATALGVEPVPLNPDWTDEDAAFALTRAQVRLLVCDDALMARAVNVTRGLADVWPLSVVSGDVAHRDERYPKLPALEDEAGSVVLFTSGTTAAAAKAVKKRSGKDQRTLDLGELWGLTSEDRTLVVTPFFHSNGSAGVLSALKLGSSVVFQRRFSVNRFWPLVDRYRPTFFFTLAPILSLVLSGGPTAWEKSHSLRLVLALGSARRRAEFELRLGARVLDWYGTTETGGVIGSGLEDSPDGAIGRALPGVHPRLLRPDFTECADMEPGELAFDCDEIGFDGYLDDPETTNKAIRDGLFLTGDIAWRDEKGFFYFVDRVKDIVRRGGENISSLEVESVLQQHPDVQEVTVLGLPDGVLEERVAALIVLRPGSPPLSLEQLRVFAGGRLARFKLPENFWIVPALPRTSNGKVHKVRARTLMGLLACSNGDSHFPQPPIQDPD
jgi:carnitine-CoA ligase